MKYPLAKPYFSPECRKRVAADMDRILESGNLMMGEFQKKFEERFAEFAGAEHAVSVNTATTALTIALKYFDIAGKEVLVPSGSFVTDVSAVYFAGGQPVLVDMNPETLSFDLADLKRKRTAKTVGLIWVHLTGVISHEYAAIVEFARDNGLFVLEDASHAHGSMIDDRRAGSLGDVGVFSLFPTKTLTAGTGGMLTTDDEDLKKFATEMRIFGRNADDGTVDKLGNDWFLDEIRACVGYNQLLEADMQIAHRTEVASVYRENLRNQPGIFVLDTPPNSRTSYFQYAVFLDSRVDGRALQKALADRHGIQAKPIYRATHQEVVFRDLDDGTLSRTAETLDRSLCLPLNMSITVADAETISGIVADEVRAQLAS